MSRYWTVRVFDTSGEGLLQASELANVIPSSTLQDVLIDLLDHVADREIQSVRLQSSKAHQPVKALESSLQCCT